MASKLSRVIKKKATRLQDITSVLQKLEELKYVERLSKLFEEIFFSEQEFTRTELKRILRSKPGNYSIDLREQFYQNTQLFKQNFEVINSLILNEVWDNVSASFNVTNSEQSSEQRSQHRGESSQNGDSAHPTESDQAITGYPQPLQTQSNDEPIVNEGESPKQQSLRISQADNIKNQPRENQLKSSLLVNNTSTYSINSSLVQSPQNETWVRANLKQRNSSRSQEAHDQHENSHSKRLNSMNNSSTLHNSRSNQSILDIKKQTEKRMSTTNLSMASSKSLSTSKLGLSSPFSEIAETKNPLQTSFSRAPRRLADKEMSQSPGPHDYRIEASEKLVRKSSPKASFGHTKRSNFVDEKQRIESSAQTPGPQYNVSQAAIYKPFKK